jgi:hypothetical protein
MNGAASRMAIGLANGRDNNTSTMSLSNYAKGRAISNLRSLDHNEKHTDFGIRDSFVKGVGWMKYVRQCTHFFPLFL